MHGERQAGGRLRAADEQVELHVHEAGQEREVAEVDLGPGGGDTDRVDRGDAVALDDDDRGRPHLAGLHVDPAGRTKRDAVGHGTGSMTLSNEADPVSGTRGWPHASTGNDTMIIE